MTSSAKSDIVNELKNGDDIVEVTKHPDADIIGDFEKEDKPKELTNNEKQSEVDKKIRKKEIKEDVKDLHISELTRRRYTVWYMEITRVQMMVKTDSKYKEMSKVFDYEWLFTK